MKIPVFKWTLEQKLLGAYLTIAGGFMVATCPGGPLIGALIIIPVYGFTFFLAALLLEKKEGNGI